MLNGTIKCRLNRGNLTSFVRQWLDSKMAVHFPSPLTLWLGESKLSMTKYIAALNIFGQDITLQLPRWNSSLILHISVYWGTMKYIWDVMKDKNPRSKVR